MPLTTDPSAGPSRLLLDLADGALQPDEVDALVQLVQAQSRPAPAPLLARAARLASERPRQDAAGLVRRLLAQLSFDSRLTPAYAGMRAEGAAVHRLLYSAEGYEIDLQIVPSDERVSLRGELSAPNGSVPAAQVRLVAGQQVFATTLDRYGQFALSDLEPGADQLEIQVGETRIEPPNYIL